MHLSVAMIVRDEARFLPGCMASVCGLADEVVVVDTGSTDGTPALAEAAGARVLHHAWTEDFSAARNASLAACTGDWILVLDADEAVDPTDHGRIRAALEVDGIHGYRLPVRSYLSSGAAFGHGARVLANDGRYATGREYAHLDLSSHLRLFRAQPGPVFRGRIHELPDAYFQEHGLLVADLDAALHHFGKVDARRDRAKQAHYLRLAKEVLAGRPEDPEAHWNVLQEALPVQDWPAARASAEALLRLQGGGPAFVHLGLARACLELGAPGSALEASAAVLRVEPDHAPALTLRGEALAALGHWDEAQEAFAAAMAAQPTYTLSYLQASEAMRRAGQEDLARQLLEVGLDQNPVDHRLWEAYVATSAPAEAPRRAWEALQALPLGGSGIWHQLVITALLAQGDREAALHVLALGQEAFPDDPGLRGLEARLTR